MDSYSNLDGATWHGAAPYVDGVKRNTDLKAYLIHLGRPDLATWMPFREWLMGFPVGWADKTPLAMHRFQQWLDSHGKR